MNADDIIFFIAGACSISLGSDIFSSSIQNFVSYGVVNFGDYHQLIGAVFITFGFACLCSVLRKVEL